MRCDAVKLMINDSLDKTISEKKAAIVEKHLIKCESCRAEFQKLQRADALLRKTVMEIVSQIEVPAYLNDRIEDALAREQVKQSWTQRLPLIFKTPAFAAVLLLAVASAGILGLHGPFKRGVQRTGVVMQVPTNTFQPEAGDTLREELQKPQPLEGQSTFYDNDQDGGKQAQPEMVPPGYGELGPGTGQGKEPASPTAQQSSRVSNVGKLFAAAEEPPMNVSSLPALKKGTPDEAAKETGFPPARPSYLPQGTELEDVAWRSGVVCQSYRNGRQYFKIIQGRSDLMSFNYEEELRQNGKPVLINGLQAVLHQTGSDAGGGASAGEISIRWARGEWTFAVTGNLSQEELIKIASSLK